MAAASSAVTLAGVSAEIFPTTVTEVLTGSSGGASCAASTRQQISISSAAASPRGAPSPGLHAL
jgi:hypothetical protein